MPAYSGSRDCASVEDVVHAVAEGPALRCKESGQFGHLIWLAGAQDHPYRSFENVLATPHIGYVSRDLYRTFYGDTVKNIAAWLESSQHLDD